MKISFSLEASSVLKDIELYVESLNTKGSGQRFIRKFRQSIKKFAQPNVAYKLCHNEALAILKFSCITINNWIIVFRIESNTFNVYDIIWGAMLV